MATKKTSTKSTPARKPAANTARKSETKTTVRSKSSSSRTAAARSTAAKTTITPEIIEKPTTTPQTKQKAFKIKKSYLILAAVVIIIGSLLLIFRNLFVAAVVNGQPISRLEIVQEAEKQSGKQVLTTIIRNKLIEQEARKQNVNVSEKEVDDEIKKLEGNLQKQGQKLDQVLTMQGMTKNDLRKLIKLDKMVGKLVGKDIKITDQQVNEYIEANKESLPADQNENDLKNTVREQLKQQQLNEKVRTWLEDIQKKAKIDQFVSY